MLTADRRSFRRPRAVIWLAIVVALVVAACGSSETSAPPTPSPSATSETPAPATSTPSPSAPAQSPSASGDTVAIYDDVEAQVVAIRGLAQVRPVERQFIDEAELRMLITQQFDEETPPEYLAAVDRLYKAVGLIPVTSDLRDLYLDLLSGSVAGFYRNDQGKLYVVSKTGTPGAVERFFFAHEFDHALQDQNSTIFSDQDGLKDQGDRILARQAIYEGDATLVMTQWAAANLDQADILDLLAASTDPEAQAVLARTPAILRDTLTFPYTTGFGYISAVQAAGGWPAVNAYFADMPESTEQIMHPEKYETREAPVAVALPPKLATRLGEGWSVSLEDTFGEFQMGIWLRETGVPALDALAAAAGWGGDRLAVVEGPDGAWAVVMQTAWDSAGDATEFEAAATTAIKSAGGIASVLPGSGGNVRWVLIASNAATLNLVAGSLGLAG